MPAVLLGRRGLTDTRWTAALQGVRALATQMQTNGGSNPGEAFAAQLQSKTERELLELLERRDQQPQAAQQAETPSNGQGGDSGRVQEVDGPRGPEPTRFGDWEQKGRCSDF